MAVALVVYLIVPDNRMAPCVAWVATLVALVTASVTNACLGNINHRSRSEFLGPALPHQSTTNLTVESDSCRPSHFINNPKPKTVALLA